jgi:hypothetical protein
MPSKFQPGKMRSSIPVYTISLPEYTIEQEPDYLAVGSKIDHLIETHFLGKKIAIRGISLADHPGWSLDALVATILTLGTDKYDPQRKGVLHEFYQPFAIDMHAVPGMVSVSKGLESPHCQGPSVMAEFVGDFYTGPAVDRGGPPLRIDILMIYDHHQLEPVFVPYEGEPDAEPCEFRFKHPDQKQKALLGIIKILR